MPVADYTTYCRMLDRARTGKFAYPAVNVTSLTTANAVLSGLAESRSDGIIQVSTGGGAFASGAAVKDMALGAISIAEHVHRVADRYPIHVALHTDHCQADKLDAFVMPLVEETERRRAAGRPNLFTGHMFDGSALPLKDNLDIAVKLRDRFSKSDLDPRNRSRRRRRRGGRHPRERRGKALHDAGRHAGSRAAAERERGSPVPPGRDLRQRARRVQAGPRQAQAVDPEGLPGCRRQGVRRRGALLLRLPRRLRIRASGHPRSAGLRRGEDERRYRHAICLHARHRRSLLQDTTTACSGSTAKSATRRPTTRAPTWRWPSRRWPIASSARRRTCGRPEWPW